MSAAFLDFERRVAESLKDFLPLFEAFESAGYQFYAVGGCVRDWVMGKVPKDIDFCTDALPKDSKSILEACGLKSIAVGEAFGTVATLIDRKTYEITTFRIKESYTRGSRHPSVCYGHDLEQDLERRDLTINAMAVDRHAKLIDPLGGLADIQAKLLRVPRSSPERSLDIFGDDPLRILRLARFCARLDFDISPDATWAARAMAGAVLGVSHERWFSEIDGLLCAPYPDKGFAWLREIGLLQLLLPEILPTLHCYRQASSLSAGKFTEGPETVYELMLKGIQRTAATSSARWIAMCRHFGTPASSEITWALEVTRLQAEGLAQRFRLSNARRQQIMRRLSQIPEGEPKPSTARRTAIALGPELKAWLDDLEVQSTLLSPSSRKSEQLRLMAWRQALTKYIEEPEAAPVHLPKGLAQALSKELKLSGKPLGIALLHCEQAVLDGKIHETAEINDFIRFLNPCEGHEHSTKEI